MFCWSKSGHRSRRGVGLASIGEAVCTCFTCECFDCTNCPSCDCDCEDICKPCGLCYAALVGCCTSSVLNVRGESYHDDSFETTGMNPESQEPVQTRTSTLMPEPSAPPPDYHTLQGIIYVYFTLYHTTIDIFTASTHFFYSALLQIGQWINISHIALT